MRRPARHLAILVLGCRLCLGAQAGDSAAPITLPPQPLDQSLVQLARLAGLQVIVPAHLTAGRMAPPVEAAKDVPAALAVLLRGTGLDWRLSDNDTLVIHIPPEREAASGPQAATPRVTEEVVVTGSHLRQAARDTGLSPVTRLTRPDMRAGGNISLPRLLQQSPLSSGAEIQVDNLAQPLTAGTAAMNLRNLGLGATLVLVDGQRQVNVPVATTEGETFVDANALLPEIAVERIDILRDGASSTYGSDAVAGAINLLPRRDFQGVEVALRGAQTSHSDQRNARLAALLGGDLPWGGIHAVAALEAGRQSPLLTTDRAFTDHTVVSSLGQPGTYLTSGGLVRDPACGRAAGEVAAGNPYCLFDSSPYFDLSPEEERHQFYLYLEQPWSPSTRASFTLTHNAADVWVRASPSFPFANALPEVPVDNPGNDFGEPVQFYGRVLGAQTGASRSRSRYRSEFARFQVSRRDPAAILDAGISLGRSRTRYGRTDTVRDRLQEALDGRGGPEGNAYWNPRFGADNDPELVAGLFADWGLRGETRLMSADLSVAADNLSLRGMPLRLALGGQYRREWMSQQFAQAYNDKQFLTLGGGPDFSARRDVTSFHAEALLSPSPTLDLQVGGRYEHAGGDTGALSPKVALLWQVGEHQGLRLSWGRAFRAPSLFQTRGSQSVPVAVSADHVPGTPLFTNVITHGDADLAPSTADVLTAGWQAALPAGLRANLDIWYYDYRDVILKESPQTILERAEAGDPSAVAKVSRDPDTGQLTEIRADFINAADIRAAGVDGSLGAEFPWRNGTFETGLSWSWTERFDIRTSAGEVISGAGSRNATTPAARPLPRLKAYAWLGWRSERFEGRARLNGISGYRDDLNPGHSVASQVTLDLHLRWPRLLPGNVDLALGVYNATDRDPPRVDTFLGYDARTHDPRGRVAYLELQWRQQ